MKNKICLTDLFRRISNTIVSISAAFIIIIGIFLALYYNNYKNIDILDAPELTALHTELMETGYKDEPLKTKIRDLDMIYRRAWFSGQTYIADGLKLIFFGLIIFIIFLNISIFTTRRLPDLPETDRHIFFKHNKKLRLASLTIGIIFIAAISFLYLIKPKQLIKITVKKTEGIQYIYSDYENLKKNWSNFRGPLANGFSAEHQLADSFTVEKKWQIATESTGFSSPVIWSDKIFITSGDKNKLIIQCYDTEDGALVWQYETPTDNLQHLKDLYDEPGFASPTPAVDEARVYAVFANGLLVCVDTENGAELWRKQLPLNKIVYGYSSSLLIHSKYLVVQHDMKNAQTIFCFDAATGNELWKNPRKSDESWASPALVNHNEKLILLTATCSSVEAFELETGKQLWKNDMLSGEVAASLAYSNGKVLLASEFACAAALNIETGEALWKNFDLYLPDVSSPAAVNDMFFITTTGGDMQCVNIANGELFWQYHNNTGFYSSSVIISDKIICADMSGNIKFINAESAKYNLINEYSVNERIVATPAVINNALIIRADKYLYRLDIKEN